MAYTFTREQLDQILELCAGTQSNIGERYKKHVDMALEELTNTIKTMVQDKLDLNAGGDQKAHVHPYIRFNNRVDRIVEHERAEERAKRDIKAVKVKFNHIREVIADAEAKIHTGKDIAGARQTLEQIRQIIGNKRGADDDESDDVVEVGPEHITKKRA